MHIEKQYFYKFLILSLGILIFYTSVIPIDFTRIFWDLDIYERAVYDYAQGGFPYRTDITLQFVYHPYVLIFLNLLNEILVLRIAFPLLFIIVTIYFWKQLFQYILLIEQEEKLTSRLSIFWLVLPSIAFGGAGILSIATGNLTLFLHFLLLGIFFNAKKNPTYARIFLFQSVILFAAIVKPYFLAYLILIVYLTDYKRFFLLTMVTVSLASGIWISGRFFAYDLYELFVLSLKHQTLGKGDLGYSVFGFLRHFTGDSTGLLIHTLVMLFTLVGLVIFVRWKGYDLRSEKTIPLVIVLIIFINPRMKEYDFPIAIFFIYLFLFLQNQSLYLKAIFISWSIATIPLLAKLLIKLGLIEPAKILTAEYPFQILGFLVVLVFLMFPLKNTQRYS